MSEMTSVVEQQQQQQQQFATSGSGPANSSASDKLCCKECGLNFDSSSSLEVHLQYHQEALMSRWASQSQQQQHSGQSDAESNNNNNVNKPASVQVKRESVSAAADSSESSANGQPRPPSEGPTSTHNFVQHHHFGYPDQQQQQQQQQQYMMAQQHGEHYILPHHFSPERADSEGNSARSGYQQRYHPYQHPQMFGSGSQQDGQQRANSVSSTSPRSPPLQCDKCGAVYEDVAQLSEHARSAHPASGSPIVQCNSSSAFQQPTQSQQAQPPQYQQLAASPQHVTQSQQHGQAQTQQQQMQHASPSGQAQQQQQQQPAYDFSPVIKSEPKQEPEEQAEILDLDSHKVQTHRYEEEFMRIQQQQQQQHHQHEMHLQMQQQVIQQQQQQQQQQRGGSHSVNSMLSWPPVTQSHEYHSGPGSMNPMESVSPSIQEPHGQFMRGQPPPPVAAPPQQQQQQQHMPQVESPRLPGSPIISSTQPIPGLPIGPASLMQQNPKPPPISGNQSWKSNEARRPKTYNCTACNKWFTSSGHLKRHYNTTLHKNAVKQSNQPDPANQPISVHHHPARDPNPGAGRGAASAASRTSPELPSSSSPPNLMAGPSGEATRGLLHTPTNSTPMFSSSVSTNSSNSNNSSSSEASLIKQESLQSQQVQQQPMPAILASSLLYHASAPATSPMGSQLHQQQQPGHLSRSHHQQQMDLPAQHQQQRHHLPMGSPSQIGSGVHHPMSSPMSPIHQSPHPVHMSSPTPLGPSSSTTTNSTTSSHHLPMSSPSPTTMGPGGLMGPSSAGQMGPSPPPSGHMMGGTTMPHQPYPNALPPHVTAITSTLGLLESITNTLTTTGNSSGSEIADQQQDQRQEMLPGFGTFSNHHQYQHPQQKMLPSFVQFGGVANGFTAGQSQQAANVGGLSPEENMPPPDSKSPFQPPPGYDLYHHHHHHHQQQPQQHHHQQHQQRYDIYDLSQSASAGQQQQHQPLMHHQLGQGAPQSINASNNEQQQSLRETNNNLPVKAEANSNRVIQTKKPRANSNPRGKKASAAAATTKDNQVTSTGSNYISENGLHKCIECDKMFNKACYLTQHNKSFHSGDKPFKCSQCGKRFPLEYLHAEHLQKHAGEKPYKCEICPKQFNHKTDLRRHLCLHTGEKPYACDNCGKGFIRKDHMMKHVETHKRKANNHKLHLRA